LKQSLVRAVLTDPHFWLPITILILGIGLLIAVR
jgi:hypothetical protein